MKKFAAIAVTLVVVGVLAAIGAGNAEQAESEGAEAPVSSSEEAK